MKAAGAAEAKYLSFLSHDLRNNLNGVNLSLEVLKRRLAADPAFAEDVEDLEAARRAIFETMDGMNRLLQAERIRKGADPKLAQVDLHLLASEVAHQFSRRAAEKGVSIEVRGAARRHRPQRPRVGDAGATEPGGQRRQVQQQGHGAAGVRAAGGDERGEAPEGRAGRGGRRG